MTDLSPELDDPETANPAPLPDGGDLAEAAARYLAGGDGAHPPRISLAISSGWRPATGQNARAKSNVHGRIAGFQERPQGIWRPPPISELQEEVARRLRRAWPVARRREHARAVGAQHQPPSHPDHTSDLSVVVQAAHVVEQVLDGRREAPRGGPLYRRLGDRHRRH
jgi:hypothetical protein